MVKCVLSTTRGVQNTGVSNNTSQFWWLGNSTLLGGTEVQREVTWHTAGTLSNLYVRITANAANTAADIIVRKNQADTTLTVSIGIGATGVFEDTTHTVSVADGDELCYKNLNPGAGTYTMSVLSVVFDATTGCEARHTVEGYSITTASSTLYIQISGDRSGTTGTESNVETTLKKPVTAKNGFVFIASNARTTTTTWTLRKSLADTAVVLTVGAGATGIFEDTANSISYAVDDEIDWKIISGAGTEALSFHSLAISLVSTNNVGVIAAGSVGASADLVVNANLTRYITLGGSFMVDTTEANTKQKLRFATTLSNMTIRISPNTVTANTTFTLRKNGAAGNQTITIGSGATGFFTDTTNEDNVTATDELNYELVTGATGTSLTIRTTTIYSRTLARVSQTYTHLYDIRSRVSKTYTHIYNISGRVSKTFTHIYNISGRVSQSYTSLYNIKARVSQTYTFTYNISARVSATYTHIYNVRGFVSKSFTHIYNIKGRVTQTYTFKYNIAQELTPEESIEPQYFISGLGQVKKRRGKQKGYRAIEEQLRQEHDKQRRLFRPRVPIPAPLRVIKEPTQVVAEDDSVRNIVFCSIEIPLIRLENVAVANIDLVREPWPIIATASLSIKETESTDKDIDVDTESELLVPRAMANIRVALADDHSANCDGIIVEDTPSQTISAKMIDQIKQAKIVKLLTLVQLFQLASKL